ncbi:MAG: uracil-DNA glycosylase family protein, partial [Stellaceae bacterium]
MPTPPEAGGARDLIPPGATVAELRGAAAKCIACPLYRDATQTVFGEGEREAGIMLVGEQPGDAEDLAGRPFVGPAGRLLDRCIKEAGIDRSR